MAPSERGAEAFLAALAGGNVQAVAQELHPDELEKLRTRLLTLLRAEASRSDNTYRSRLFGPGRSLAELESMTAVRFYAALSDRVRFRAREYEKVRLAGRRARRQGGVPGRQGQSSRRSAGAVKVARDGRARCSTARSGAPSSRAKSKRSSTTSSKAASPPAPPPSGGAPGRSLRRSARPAPLAPGISELLARAEASLAAGNCEEYYSEFMSPNFNKATSKSARKTLITACTNSESTRETMITTLRVVQELSPKYDLGGARAIYDVSGQGLPYDRFVLERDKDMRWYIAE